MNFYEQEKILDVIKSEIENSKKQIQDEMHNKSIQDNKYMKNMYKSIKNYEYNILNEKIQQLKFIEYLYEYLENSINDKNKKKILFQQKKLDKRRKNLIKTIKKYL
tara:strand:- start:321 stop:638 length:318 start_codon:yes stop_codon:yes gene_type:complete